MLSVMLMLIIMPFVHKKKKEETAVQLHYHHFTREYSKINTLKCR